MLEGGRHDGPATHAVTFVWNGQEVTPDLELKGNKMPCLYVILELD